MWCCSLVEDLRNLSCDQLRFAELASEVFPELTVGLCTVG